MENYHLNKWELAEMTHDEMQNVEGGAFLCILAAIMLFSATIALIGEIID